MAVGLLWIVASDQIARAVRVPFIETEKGAAFVLVTAALLYWVLSRAANSIREFQTGLIASEERFRSVVEAAPVGVFIQTRGRFRYVNSAALKTFGAASLDRLRDESVFDRIDPAFHDVVRQRMHDMAERHQRVSSLQEIYLRLDGTPVDVEVLAVPFEFAGEQGALVFFTDISARIRAEQEKRLLEEQFRQAQKMESVGRLAGGIAHDFNNLLTVINGYSELLLSRMPAGDRNFDAIQQIHDAGGRAIGITKQLLAFSRKDTMERSVVDPNDVILGCEQMLRRLVGEKVRLRTTLAEGTGKVLSDTGWLTQVLLNLTANARDAMPDGGKLIIETAGESIGEDYCRRVAGSHPCRAVRITVRDTGCGMDEATRQRIFEPFFTTKSMGQGTGLGLSIVYGIVKSSGGWLEVTSGARDGTAVSIFLPVCKEHPASAGRLEPSVVPPGNETILLVEDEASVRDFTESVLKGAGYRVVPCTSGEDAIQQAAREGQPIHLLLADVMMPGMSGTQLADVLAEQFPNVRVILISGYSPDDLTPSLTSRHQAFLAKPFTAAALLQIVRQVLDEVGRASA